MKEFENESEKIDFEIYRMKREIKVYVDRCEIFGLEASRLDELLDKLNELMKLRDEINK